MKTLIKITITMLACSFALAAWTPAINPYHVRSMAMGGAFTAVANDHYTLFANPAGLRNERRKDSVSVMHITPHINSRIVPWIETALDFGKEDGPSADDLIDMLTTNNLYPSIGFNGPIYFGVNFDGFGFVMADALRVGLAIEQEMTPRIGVTVDFSLQLKFAYAHEFDIMGMPLKVGAGVKTLAYAHAAPYINIETMGTNGRKIASEMLDTAKAGIGFGFDIGGLFEPIENFTVALAVDDIVSPLFLVSHAYMMSVFGNSLGDSIQDGLNGLFEDLGDKGTPPSPESGASGNDEDASFGFADLDFILPNLKIGASYFMEEIPVIGWMIPSIFLRDITATVEWKDFFSGNKTPFTMFHFGVEFSAVKLPFLDVMLRGGLNKGYLTGGVGIQFGPFNLEYAYFTEELSPYPGYKPNGMHLANVSFRW